MEGHWSINPKELSGILMHPPTEVNVSPNLPLLKWWKYTKG